MSVRGSFSGSYGLEDVVFLLQPIAMAYTDLDTKERLLQSGTRHYSEMLSPEQVPTAEYLDLYGRVLEANADWLAHGVCALAERIDASVKGRVRVVSLARAGTPVGVLLKRALISRFGRDVDHFSISIIAGRAIDVRALDHIRALSGFNDAEVVFVDGWTGKGVIGGALRRYVEEYNDARSAHLDPTLYVISDLCGSTPAAYTTEDRLIPSCLLGATVSGLISRTVFNEQLDASGGFHGCVYFPELLQQDQSRRFVDVVSSRFRDVPFSVPSPPPRDLRREQQAARFALELLQQEFGYASCALIKPGLGEATRAILRRSAAHVLVRDLQDPEVEPIRFLAGERSVPLSCRADMPWRAVSIIGRA